MSKKFKSHVEVVRGTSLVTLTSASNVQFMLGHPTAINSSRLLAISDAFMLFRFVKVHMTPISWSSTPGQQNLNSLGYTVDQLNANVTTAAEVAEFQPSVQWHTALTVLGPVLKAEGSDLVGLIPWYRTRVGAGVDDQLEYQGNFWQRTSGATDAVTYRVEFVCELKDFAPSSLTLVPRGLAPVLRRPCPPSDAPPAGTREVVLDEEYVTLRVPKLSLEHKG